MPDSRLVVITGASRGLGRAMVDEFVAVGHTVAGCARSNGSIADLQKQYGSPHRFDVVDVSDDGQVEGWAAAVLQTMGPADILINSAGLINENAPLWETSPAQFSRLVDVNIKGVHNTIFHLVPSMVRRGTGVIVNFSSYWGRSTASEVAAYCATKWAIEGLSRGLADDLPSGMASIALNPGVIHTDMLDSCFGASAASYPEPSEWAERAVPFLLKIGPRDNGEPLTVRG